MIKPERNPIPQIYKGHSAARREYKKEKANRNKDSKMTEEVKHRQLLKREEQEPTTRKEVWAWWLYMAAIEPISVAVLQLFLPLLLKNLALMVGHIAGQPSVSCTGEDGEDCVLFELSNFAVTGTTFSYGIITLSVALQAIVFVCFGALADYGSARRKFLTGVTTLGAMFCVGIMGVRGTYSALIAGILDILITISFGVALMLYNSYLPLLAADHPDTTSFRSDDPEEMARQREVVSSDLSTKSFMLGYGSAILILGLCAGYMILFQDFASELHVIAFCGLVWGFGAIWPLYSLKARPGPNLPEGANRLTFSIIKTGQTLAKCNKLPHTFRYLMAYFLFADGCNTIGQVAVIFASDVLKASITQLIICAMLAPFCGVLGNYFFFFLQKKFGITGKSMLLVILAGFTILTAYGGSGVYFEAFGLHHKWELYLVAAVYGFLMGAMQSFSRVLFAEMIPPGEEAEFFSLYAITDKGSSWLGPLIQMLVTHFMPDQRYGLFFLGLMIITPFPLVIWGVDPVMGKSDAMAFAGLTNQRNPQMTEK